MANNAATFTPKQNSIEARSSHSGGEQLPIFHNYGTPFPQNESNDKGPLSEEKDKTEPNDLPDSSAFDGSIRDSMLKAPGNTVISPFSSQSLNPERNVPDTFSKWSQHPFVKPNYYYYSSSSKTNNGEWKVETRIGTFSSDHGSSDYFGSNFYPDIFGQSSSSDMFSSDSDSDIFAPNSDLFSFFKMGPGDLFQQMFDMMRQFQQFGDSSNPFTQPPRM